MHERALPNPFCPIAFTMSQPSSFAALPWYRSCCWAAVLVVLCSCSETSSSKDGAAGSSHPNAGLSVAATASKPAPSPSTCGPLACRLFDTPQQAFAAVLGQKPLLLAVGEAHAQAGSKKVPSATQRFTETLLPMLKGKATDLIIELLVADAKCKKTVRKVAAVQKPVTTKQRTTNKSEFVVLGEKSKSLGIKPHALFPKCKDYQAVVKAGPDGVSQMLTMIAELTQAKVERLLTQSDGALSAKSRLFIAYGGALHNDIKPPKGREAWSFGPQLYERTAKRYVALDLIVPEFIKDSKSWRSLVWYPHFDKAKHAKRTTLFNPSPGSYVLIFPATAESATPSASPEPADSGH